MDGVEKDLRNLDAVYWKKKSTRGGWLKKVFKSRPRPTTVCNANNNNNNNRNNSFFTFISFYFTYKEVLL
jgi:hypothetical protein